MNNKRRLNGIGIAGCILNIICAVCLLIGLIFASVAVIVQALEDYNFFGTFFDNFFIDFIVQVLVVCILLLFSILSLVKNSKLLSGKIDRKAGAIVFSIFTFSLLGAIFLMIGRVVVVVEKVEVRIVQEVLDYHGLIELILKYKTLLDSGVINETEFSQLKANLFNQLK